MPITPQTGIFTSLAQLWARQRDLLPSDMSSAELRTLDDTIRRRSLFSARTTNAQYLQEVANQLEQLLAGEVNEASARARLQDVLELLNYDPAFGFPGDFPNVPFAETGSLRDLSSERRVKLVLETQERMAANAGLMREGNTTENLFAFPAWELVRIYVRAEERGDWPSRFITASGTLFDGRMIARKDASVWSNLGSSALFEDGLDNPHPPYAFNSGMGWREVPRDEAIALGVIDPEDLPEISDPAFEAELDLNAEQFDAEFLNALQGELEAELV